MRARKQQKTLGVENLDLITVQSPRLDVSSVGCETVERGRFQQRAAVGCAGEGLKEGDC